MQFEVNKTENPNDTQDKRDIIDHTDDALLLYSDELHDSGII